MTPAQQVLHIVQARLADPKPVTTEMLAKVVEKTLEQHFPDTAPVEVIAELAAALVAERTTRDVPSEWAWLEITHIHTRLSELLARREQRRRDALGQVVEP